MQALAKLLPEAAGKLPRLVARQPFLLAKSPRALARAVRQVGACVFGLVCARSAWAQRGVCGCSLCRCCAASPALTRTRLDDHT
jgi:hypothetical protein